MSFNSDLYFRKLEEEAKQLFHDDAPKPLRLVYFMIAPQVHFLPIQDKAALITILPGRPRGYAAGWYILDGTRANGSFVTNAYAGPTPGANGLVVCGKYRDFSIEHGVIVRGPRANAQLDCLVNRLFGTRSRDAAPNRSSEYKRLLDEAKREFDLADAQRRMDSRPGHKHKGL